MAVGIEEEEEEETELIITKARNDKRDYRRIVLSNCLQVLLISDPETDKAAASMAVRVGSDNDPDGLEGLAHFLEHMLFYASEKYPMEDSYSKYISENGGSTNAFTSSEYTNYYFDVNTDSFEEALDRFAQFFIKPLMSADATMREIKAVDSENQKNLLSDGWRMSQLQKHLSAEGHPYHKFSTGNWDTLEVQPKEKGLDTRVELIKFYEENYSANLMYLVVYGKESLDELQSLVDEKFQEIRNTDRSRFIYPGQPCTSDHLQILVKAVPIKEGHMLNIVWPITPCFLHYKSIPTDYLGHLIGHEGEGSVFYILKTLGWATSLSAGGYNYSTEVSFFQVSISLTDTGQEHMEDVIGLLFKYIAIIQESGIDKWIFDELSVICETGFHYQDKSPPIGYVVGVTSNMLFYPPKDWLVASSLPSNFSPGTIQMILNELTPNNVRIFWYSKKFDGHTEMVEPWYGTAYSLEKIGSSMIQQWVEAAPTEHLRLPVPNIFIPTDLSLKDVPEKAKFPVLLRKSSYLRLWYKADSMFSTPKAYVKIAFDCPYSRHTPEAQVLTDIFTSLLEDYLNEYAYDADVAGLSYGVCSTSTGFQVTVAGYNHKMRILVDKIIEQIAEFKVKPDRFSVIKEIVTKGYQNVKFQQPYQQASYYCSLILADQSWPWNEEHEVLSHLEAADLEKFTPVLLSKAFLECYVAGNIEPNEAKSMILHIENVFFKGPHSICRPLFPSEHLANRTVKLEKGISHYYSVEVPNQTDENSALVHYIQLHQDDSMLNVKLQLFAFIANRPFFHQLRSVEQLGYITMLKLRGDSGVRGMSFVIQSTVKDPGQIDLRIEAFLKDFESKLYEMPDDKFKSNVNSLVEMNLEKFKNLWEECSFYWGEIVAGTYKFNRIESEIAELKRLSQQELVDYFNDYIKVGAPMKKTLSVHVYGGLHSAEYKAIKSETSKPNTFIIDDIFSFRRSRPLYGSSKNVIGHMTL